MTRLKAATLALCLGTTPILAEDLSRAEIEALVLDTIRANPEIVMEAIEALQARNPDGDVTIVEFFDYNCGYCRRVFGDVKALIAADSNVRVVMREWPILGEASVFAARASLASRKQGKFEEFHVALMEQNGRASEEVVMKVAADLGMDTDQLRRDMEAPDVAAHIQTSQQLTQALGLNGTPAFVFGSELVPGAIELEQMQALVEQVREAG